MKLLCNLIFISLFSLTLLTSVKHSHEHQERHLDQCIQCIILKKTLETFDVSSDLEFELAEPLFERVIVFSFNNHSLKTLTFYKSLARAPPTFS